MQYFSITQSLSSILGELSAQELISLFHYRIATKCEIKLNSCEGINVIIVLSMLCSVTYVAFVICFRSSFSRFARQK